MFCSRSQKLIYFMVSCVTPWLLTFGFRLHQTIQKLLVTRILTFHVYVQLNDVDVVRTVLSPEPVSVFRGVMLLSLSMFMGSFYHLLLLTNHQRDE